MKGVQEGASTKLREEFIHGDGCRRSIAWSFRPALQTYLSLKRKIKKVSYQAAQYRAIFRTQLCALKLN